MNNNISYFFQLVRVGILHFTLPQLKKKRKKNIINENIYIIYIQQDITQNKNTSVLIIIAKRKVDDSTHDIGHGQSRIVFFQAQPYFIENGHSLEHVLRYSHVNH